MAAFCLLAGTVAAAPQGIDSLSKATSLDSAQDTQIQTYAQYWADLLRTSDKPGEVHESRNRLIRPLRTINGIPASLMFRSTYSKILLPILEPIVDGDSRYRAVNALQIIANLGTPKSLGVLDEHVDPEVEKRAEVRLWSAIGIGRSMDFHELRSDKIKGALRVMARSAEVETNPIVLQRELEALDLAVRNTRQDSLGGGDLRDIAIELELAVLAKTIDRLENGSAPTSMLSALQPGLVLVRNQYIDPQLQRQQLAKVGEKAAAYIGKKAAPQMGRIYDVILVNETTIRANPQMVQTAGQLIRLSEETLKLMDSHLRANQAPPKTTAGQELWSNRDLAGLEASRDAWQSVLTRQPYLSNAPGR